MGVLPIDLTALVGTILGISIVLVPVIGLTARFALQPLVEALGRSSERKGLKDAVQVLASRLELQERELESLRGSLHQLEEANDFDRQLRAPARRPLQVPGDLQRAEE
jgi:hypothetical protein